MKPIYIPLGCIDDLEGHNIETLQLLQCIIHVALELSTQPLELCVFFGSRNMHKSLQGFRIPIIHPFKPPKSTKEGANKVNIRWGMYSAIIKPNCISSQNTLHNAPHIWGTTSKGICQVINQPISYGRSINLLKVTRQCKVLSPQARMGQEEVIPLN
jgi:hypothetical protein